MIPPGRRIQVEFVATPGEAGEALWSACFPPPLEGRFWYDALEDSGLEDQFAFRYAVIRADGEPVGIAPCFLHDVPIALVAPRPVGLVLGVLSRMFPRVGLQRTLFVGSPCSDEGSIGLVPGVSPAEVARELGAAVRAEARRLAAPMVVFKDFTEAGRAALAGLCGSGGFFPIVSYPGTAVALPAPDREAWLRSLPHLQRHNFLKKMRRSRELLTLETTVVERPFEPELGEITALDLGTGSARFDPNIEESHHHLVCRACGKVRDIKADIPGLEVPAGASQGFVISSADVVFRGLCDECQ